MINYKRKKGIGSFSELVRKSFEIYEKLFPLDSKEASDKGLYDRLEAIEAHLRELREERELTMNQSESIDKQISLLHEQTEHIDSKLREMTLEEIPKSNEIAEKIIKLIREFRSNITGGIKDFVLMGYLRKDYSDSLLWATLNKLRENKKIIIENGVWKEYPKK